MAIDVSHDKPWANTIDTDAERREFERGRLRQTANAPFARRIGRVRVSGQCRIGRDIDNRTAALRAHDRCDLAHTKKGACEIDVEYPAPLRFGIVRDRLTIENAGIVDQDVNTPAPLQH